MVAVTDGLKQDGPAWRFARDALLCDELGLIRRVRRRVSLLD